MARDKKISRALSAAAATLLGSSAEAGLLDYDFGGQDWDAEAAFLLYSESDGRVSAVAPALQLTRTIDTDESVTLRFTLDALTGASPNGAVPSKSVQTFTGPSGSSDYRVEAGQTPLDDTFKDTRAALSASWTQALSRENTLTLGSHLSVEFDYLSLGANASLARDFNQRNTTLSAGLSVSADTISPVGGTPTPYAATAVDGDDDQRPDNDQNKTVTDLLFGLTQVIDRDSVLQLSLGLGLSDGYHNDPYKLISVVDNNGDPTETIHENRPDSRSRQSLYTQYKRNMNDAVLNTAYRYMRDDWGIRSHTVDISYRLPAGTGWWQPRLRLYSQTATDFYRPYLLDGEQPTAGVDSSYASADYRLGEMDTTTVGLSYGRDGDRPWQLSVEYYLQTPKEPEAKIGSLRQLTLAPEMSAVILRLNLDL